MKQKAYPFLASFLAGALLLTSLTGCQALKDTYKSQTAKGATIGAVLGAMTGAVVAKKTDGNVAKGAVIGAAAGVVVGAGVGALMDKQARELEEKLKEEAQVAAVKDSAGNTVGVHLVFSSGILFDTNKSDLRPDVQRSLDTLAASLQRYPDTALIIVGHTDADGTDAYNQKLSEARSSSVARHLESRGVAGTRIRAMGLGESSPVAPNDTPANKQKNRRVEIGIAPVTAD